MNGNTIRTFLGANSSEGFASLYDTFPGNDRTYVIKGGPGSGKSSLMKKVAAEAIRRGYVTEYGYCSSDAESLDAIRVPEKNFCIVDGTSPHLTEPRYPGALDEIIYTGNFWDGAKLQRSLPEIESISTAIRSCFARTYRYLAAAGRATDDIRACVRQTTDTEKLVRRAEGYADRSLPSTENSGIIRARFLSAISPQGAVIHRDTIYTLADRVFVLKDLWHLSDLFLEPIIATAYKNGYEVYVFYDPLCPSFAEHIAIPEAGVAFVTSNDRHPFEPQNAHRIDLTRFSSPGEEEKERIRSAKKLIGACMKEAYSTLEQEKAYHDDLEEYYIDAMDFRKFNQFVASFLRQIFDTPNG